MATEGNMGKVRDAVQQLRPGDIVGYVEHRRRIACVVSGSWYGVCCEPQQEQLARSEIAGMGLITYWPCVPREESHGRGKLRMTLRPIFPGYLFVKCDAIPEHWSAIKGSRGVKRILGCSAPLPFDDEALSAVRLHETEQWEDEKGHVAKLLAKRRAQEQGRSGFVWDFTPEEKVLIKNGPFASFVAELTAAVDDCDRITALVNAFGRYASVELSAFDIERF